jgi:chromosomal replication initiator protein
MNYQEVWQAALGELELTLSKANFTTWFKQTGLLALDDCAATIAVPNAFTKTWFEKKYHAAILKALSHASSGTVKNVLYQVDARPVSTSPIMDTGRPTDRFTASAAAVSQKTSFSPDPTNVFGMNPKYTFESFIVGKQNEMASAAAKAIVDRPGQIYNPLFLYGGVGLGKTHLMQAVGNAIIARLPQTRVLYCTCERFTNDFIQSVRGGRAKDFRDQYRNVDLLMIDDIQFIAGKKETQEEFFNTFNHLHQTNKQIILTSDRPPKAILAEERLLSRLEWGLTSDIGQPDFETRLAILEAKCKEKNFSIDPDILNIVANTITSNIRELEGALIKIMANCQLRNIAPSTEFVKQLLQSFSSSAGKRSTTPKQVLAIVAEYFDVPMVELLGASREKRLAHPRQVAMYILRQELKVSYPAIGVEVGGRDHTTAMHAFDKVSHNKDEDLKLKQDLEVLKEKIYSQTA